MLLSIRPSQEAISKIFNDFDSARTVNIGRSRDLYYSKALNLFLSYYQSEIMEDLKKSELRLLKDDLRKDGMMDIDKFKVKYYSLIKDLSFDIEAIRLVFRGSQSAFVYFCTLYNLNLKLVGQMVFSLDSPALERIFSTIVKLFEKAGNNRLLVSLVARHLGISEKILKTLISKISEDYGYANKFTITSFFEDYLYYNF